MNALLEQRFGKSMEKSKELSNFDANDMANMYILIVPPAKKCTTVNNKDALKSDQLITLTSEEFLLAFQSLLGEYEKDEIRESAVAKKDNSNKFYNSTVASYRTAQSVGKYTEIEKASNMAVIEQAVEKGGKRPRNRNKTTVTVGTQTINSAKDRCSRLTHRDKAAVAIGTQTANSENDLSSRVTNSFCAKCMVDMSKMNKEKDRGSFTAKDDAGPTVREDDLKTALFATNYNVRNVCLEGYMENWNSIRDITRLSPLMYIQTHLSLLVDYLDGNQISSQFNTKLIRRYLFHMKRLISQFSKHPNDTDRVIKFDQAIISQVRQTGSWNFTKAWSRVEVEKKENSYQQSPHNTDTEYNKFRDFEKTGGLSPNLKYSSSNRRRKRSSLSPDGRVMLHQDRDDLSSRLFSRLNNENRSLEMLQDIGSTRQVKRIPRKKSLPPLSSSAKRQRTHLTLAERIGAKSGSVVASKSKRFQNAHDLELQSQTYCKYFNAGYCFKSASKCTFLHACSICSRSSHGRFQCPDNGLNT